MPCKDITKHSLESPIWDVTITAIEVFYPGETVESPLSHALIVEDPLVAGEWGPMGPVKIPGTTDSWPRYSTKNIKDMVKIPSTLSTAYTSRRLSERRFKDPQVDNAMVCSVRVRYDKAVMFLERDGSTWLSSNGGGPVLTTEQIVNFLPST
jgi:hypothetical protein